MLLAVYRKSAISTNLIEAFFKITFCLRNITSPKKYLLSSSNLTK